MTDSTTSPVTPRAAQHGTTSSSEAAVVLRIATRLDTATFTASAIDDPLLLGPLESALTRVPRGGAVLVGSEADVVAALDPAGVHPVVLLVPADDLPSAVTPTWHTAVLEAGYVGCLVTAGWRLYVRAESADTLGPALSYPPTDAERDATQELGREAFLAEIVAWRTAALTRWSVRAYEESGKTNKDLLDELTRTTDILETVYRTFSWRVTAPLRAVQSARMRSARR
ncbi:hypothetical protein [Cellulomonas soli]|nr:hypothetical protein [Cellulomonas soli]NYI57561.1 hypothetical protein [Cellulomonas soli]